MIAAPRVLLVGHDASATGAPLAALAWVRWARRTGAADVEVVLERGGPLTRGFIAAAPTRVRSRAVGELVAAADAFGPAGARRRVRRLARTGRLPGPETTVVAASIAAWRTAAALAVRSPLVLWLHELDGVADRVVAPDERAALLRATTRIVAVGNRVADMVTGRWGVPAAQVAVVDSFVDPLPAPAPPPTGTELLAVGSLVPRKGAEHVVALAALLGRDRPDLRTSWVGGPLASPYADLIRTDVATAGLGDRFELAGPVEDLAPWWERARVLVHLAREDPAPLVVLEAAQRAIPVATWDTGGAADLLRRAGLPDLVAEPGDLSAVAGAVRQLLDHEDRRAAAGASLQHAAAERTTDLLAPQLLAAIEAHR